jgi:DNA mismatch repair protein MutS2
MRVQPKTLSVLEWAAVVGALADRCDSVVGRERVRALRTFADVNAAREEIARVGEVWRLFDEGADLPPVAFADVRPALARADREGLLDGASLREIADLLRTAGRVGRHLADEASRAPRLASLAKSLDPLPDLCRQIEATVDERGEVVDDASPELRRARERQRALQARTRARLEEILRAPEYARWLQDNYVTVRDGRYVLPFIASVDRDLRGIVHHKSQSGATAFLETPELVEANNRLTLAALEVEAEVERILRELTRSVCDAVATIARNLETLATLDLLHAKARLGRDLGGSLPEIRESGALRLCAARHPLLVLGGRPVVPNDLVLDWGRGLVITGPNTGGKTVALKTIGLAALMAAAGLPVPAGPDSEVPLYAGVFADIGDDQSIERNLSTFSAHLTHIREILEAASPGALVLLDELCAGTDPHEGAALAVSLMEAFVERGASLVVTTHYEELKAKAHVDRRFVNASFGYDPVTFAPSYLLTSGVPGRSGAIDVAARLGIPAAVVARAREVLGHRGRLDEVIAALEKERAALAHAHEEGARRAADLEKERHRLEQARRELEALRREATEQARREFLAELAEARAEVRAAVRALQKAPSGSAAQAAREILARVEDQARAHRAPPPEPSAPPPRVEAGMRVHVRNFRRSGVIVELNERKQQAMVDLGGARVVVPVASLEAPPGDGARAGPAPAARVRSGAARPEDDQPVRTPETTCDLRGMRAEDAVLAAEAFLDRALAEDRDVVFFIHGHGTGALKSAIRRYLRESRYVRRMREGRREEGGDGVTVAWLAAR